MADNEGMQIIRIQTQAQLVWSTYRDRNGWWIAICDPIGLTVQGETWGELVEGIHQTMHLMFKALYERGELEAFLRERGWQAVGPGPRVKKDVRFDIPFTFSDRPLGGAPVPVHQ